MFANRQRRVSVDEDDLSAFFVHLRRVLRLPPESFSAVLVSDRRIQELNRRYRKRSAVTDVLSFSLRENGYLGEVVISAPTARRQARHYRHRVEEEVKLLLLHGVLHLLGYDHETDRGQMARREHTLRRRLGLE